jgi:hypothetical protein
LPLLTFEPEIQAETGQKWPKKPEKRLQNAYEMPVLVDNGNGYSGDHKTADDIVIADIEQVKNAKKSFAQFLAVCRRVKPEK